MAVADPSLQQMDAPRSWITGYYGSFNGLRAVAVLTVFLNHYGRFLLPGPWINGFWVGVDLFFVLSGFLITGILFDAKAGARYFRNFYIRRALRIFPLFYGFFFILYLFAPVLHSDYPHNFWMTLLYVSNLATGTARPHMNPTYVDLPLYPDHSIVFGHLWSLCVEEQFYLVWPLVVFFLPTRRSIMNLALAATAAALALRSFLYLHDAQGIAQTAYIYTATYARCDGLFLGSWLALWLRGTLLSRRRLRLTANALVWPSLFVIAAGALTVGRRWPFNLINPLIGSYGYTLIALAFTGVLLLSLDDAGMLARVMRHPWLAALGRISYGFYFLHEIPYALVKFWYGQHQSMPYAGVLCFFGTLAGVTALAALSFRFYESQFLKLKNRLAPETTHASIPRPA